MNSSCLYMNANAQSSNNYAPRILKAIQEWDENGPVALLPLSYHHELWGTVTTGEFDPKNQHQPLKSQR